MKIMVYDGPKQLRIAEVSAPSLEKDQIRIETMFSGISHGTEMNVYRGTAPFFKRKMDWDVRLFTPANETETWNYPIRSCDPGVWQMGYSVVGKVVEVGADVKSVKVGDIVYSSAPHQSQVIKKEHEVKILPANLNPELGIFLTNLSTAHNAILDTRIKLGDTIVVSGLGVLGQLIAQMAKMSGAFTVYGIETCEKRAKAALENGVDKVFNPLECEDVALEIRKLTNNKGPSAVIEASGNIKALNEAIRIAAPDTTVTAVSWYQGSCGNLDLSEEFHHNRVTIRCSQTGGINPEIRHIWDNEKRDETITNILSRLKLDNLITKISYDNLTDAYKMIDQNPGDVIQVVLTY